MVVFSFKPVTRRTWKSRAELHLQPHISILYQWQELAMLWEIGLQLESKECAVTYKVVLFQPIAYILAPFS